MIRREFGSNVKSTVCTMITLVALMLIGNTAAKASGMPVCFAGNTVSFSNSISGTDNYIDLTGYFNYTDVDYTSGTEMCNWSYTMSWVGVNVDYWIPGQPDSNGHGVGNVGYFTFSSFTTIQGPLSNSGTHGYTADTAWSPILLSSPIDIRWRPSSTQDLHAWLVAYASANSVSSYWVYATITCTANASVTFSDPLTSYSYSWLTPHAAYLAVTYTIYQ